MDLASRSKIARTARFSAHGMRTSGIGKRIRARLGDIDLGMCMVPSLLASVCKPTGQKVHCATRQSARFTLDHDMMVHWLDWPFNCGALLCACFGAEEHSRKQQGLRSVARLARTFLKMGLATPFTEPSERTHLISKMMLATMVMRTGSAGRPSRPLNSIPMASGPQTVSPFL